MGAVTTTREVFDSLKAGDKIELEHEVKIGLTIWKTVTKGEVIEIRRRRHGLHFRRNTDDKVYSDEILIRRDTGELTTLTLDEFSLLKKI